MPNKHWVAVASSTGYFVIGFIGTSIIVPESLIYIKTHKGIKK